MISPTSAVVEVTEGVTTLVDMTYTAFLVGRLTRRLTQRASERGALPPAQLEHRKHTPLFKL